MNSREMASSFSGEEKEFVGEAQEVPALKNPSARRTPPVLVESKKQNNMASPALSNHKKQGNACVTPLQNEIFSPTCKNPWFPTCDSSKFPAGRYKSPTDSLISPISRGLLAKGRRAMKQSHALVPPKVLDEAYDVLRKPVKFNEDAEAR
eukprot:c16954_g1_i1 orf=192-641(-)